MNIMIVQHNLRVQRTSITGLLTILVLGGFALTDAPETCLADNLASSTGRPEDSRIDEHGRIVDRIDWPFVNDPAVLGKWESVDFVEEIEHFQPGRPSKQRLFLKGMVFEENGKADYGLHRWTKGKIIHVPDKTASAYTIKNIEGQQYMFREWKSGDYTIRHQKPAWYVLKKLPADTPRFASPRELFDVDVERPPAEISESQFGSADAPGAISTGIYAVCFAAISLVLLLVPAILLARRTGKPFWQNTPKRYWFPAKRYGWGWGLPATWEGWVFMLAFLPVTTLGTCWLAQRTGNPALDLGLAHAFLMLMSAVLLIVCFKKGEPPRWRWGDKE